MIKNLQLTQLAFALAMSFAANSNAAIPNYSIERLPAPPSINGAAVIGFSTQGINFAGQVIVSAQYTLTNVANPEASASAYIPLVYQSGVYSILELPSGASNARPLAINDAGVIAGVAWSDGLSGVQEAVRWDSGMPTTLPRTGNVIAGVMSLNSQSQVGGFVSDLTGQTSAAWWDAQGNLHPLNSLVGLNPSVRGINSAGQMILTGTLDSRPTSVLLQNGNSVPLSPITTALQINDHGHILGTSLGEDRNLTLYFWDGSQAQLINPLSPGFVPLNVFLNDSDLAVISWIKHDATGEQRQLTLWSDGSLYSFNQPGAAVILDYATGIASDGSVIGRGYVDGVYAQFIAHPTPSTPVPESGTIGILLFSVGLLIRRKS